MFSQFHTCKINFINKKKKKKKKPLATHTFKLFFFLEKRVFFFLAGAKGPWHGWSLPGVLNENPHLALIIRFLFDDGRLDDSWVVAH